jgi:DNA-directed RNA polymerase specialized sigma24 family protein
MKQATAHHTGAITFDQFARQNTKDWQRMARYLLRRFPADCIAEDDVVQELMIGAWQSFAKFEPTRVDKRGKPITAERYVTYNALSKAKKRILSRMRPLNEDLAGEVEDPREQECGQLEEVERSRKLKALVEQCTNLTEAVCLMVYYREEECTRTAASIYSDPQLRRLCQFGSLQHATRKVRRVLQTVCPEEVQQHV